VEFQLQRQLQLCSDRNGNAIQRAAPRGTGSGVNAAAPSGALSCGSLRSGVNVAYNDKKVEKKKTQYI